MTESCFSAFGHDAERRLPKVVGSFSYPTRHGPKVHPESKSGANRPTHRNKVIGHLLWWKDYFQPPYTESTTLPDVRAGV